LTQEHVYSRWTRRFVPRTLKSYKSLRATSYPDRTDFVFVKRPGDVRNWQVLCVCAGCNNGWMRQRVDEAARPLLISLIQGHQIRLTPQQQRTIATWAAMKAMVAEFGESEAATTHHTQRKYLMRHRLPPVKGWSVWIAHYKKTNDSFLWLSTPFLVLPDRLAQARSSRRATFYNSQVSTQVIGQLLIHVIRSPHPRLARMWKFHLPRRQGIFRIWPVSEYGITWPSATIDDATASYIADAYKEFHNRGT
jgi:hypothetical protein